MNPLHLEELANARVAELRNLALAHGYGSRSSATPAPDPRVPRRGPLATFARLGSMVRGALA